MQNTSNTKSNWYDNFWIVIFLLVFCPPAGIYALLKNTSMTKSKKIGLIAFLLVTCCIVYLITNESKNNIRYASSSNLNNNSSHESGITDANQNSPSSNNTADEIYETEDNQAPKQIEWSNGNTYSYDYTEFITTKDDKGNETLITVYKRNAPKENEIICETKVCKWCSKEVQAENYEIVEYPNINWVRGQPDISSILGMYTSMLSGKTYYDFENNRIRTEWTINCNYPGPNGFCSLKCENEYKYR